MWDISKWPHRSALASAILHSSRHTAVVSHKQGTTWGFFIGHRLGCVSILVRRADCVLLRGAHWMVSGEKVNSGGINDFRALCAALALHQFVSRSCWRSPSPTALCYWDQPLDQEDQLPDTTLGELTVFIPLHVNMQVGCCIQCRGLASPTKTCRSGSRSAAAGGCQSSGRCCSPVWSPSRW